MSLQTAITATILIILWPLVLGLLCFLVIEWRKDRDPVSRAVLSLLGLALLVLAFWLTQFPGSPLQVVNYG